MGRQDGKRGRSTKSVIGRHRHGFTVTAIATVHCAIMLRDIWEDGSKQTSWYRKLPFEML